MLVIPVLAASIYCFGTVQSAHAKENSRPISAWPLIYHRAEKERAETDVLWPLFRYEREDERTRYALRPFLFSTEGDPKEDSRKTSLLWPLTNYTRKGLRLSLHVFPVYWYGKSEDRHHTILFPFYWNGKGRDHSYFHLWPMFGVDHRQPDYTEYSTIYPFFRYGRDPQSGRLDIHAPWPLINVHRHDDYASYSFLPLYWSERSPDYQGGFIFPYYWRNTPTYRARGAFPLWYASRGPKLKTDLFFPVYFNRETPEKHLRLFMPFYVSRTCKDYRLSTLIPLYLNYEKEDMGIRVVLPSYSRYRSGTFTFSSLFPFYYHTEDTQRHTDLAYYFPFYGRYRRGETTSRHFILFPLFSKLEDSELQLKGWDVAWPFLHYERSPKTLSVRVLPFYWRTRAEDYGLTMGFPFYWSIRHQENTYTHFVPFYGIHTRGDWYKKRFILGPVCMNTQDSRSGLSRQDIVFPFYSRMRKGDKGRAWLLPFFYRKYESDERLTLGSFALLPPYYFSHKEGEDRTCHLWPFFGQSQRGSYNEYSTLWPMFRVGNDTEKGTRLTHLLLYYQKAEEERKRSAVFPFWWHLETPRNTLDSSLFLHWYETDREKETKDMAFLWLYPPGTSLIKYQQQPGRRQHAVFPLYSYDRNETTDAFRLNFIWPLFSYSSQGEFSRQTGFLWKVISYEQKGKGNSEFRFLWRLIRRAKAASSHTFEFNPLYYYESDKAGGSYWAILGGLLGVETARDQRKRVRWLWIFG